MPFGKWRDFADCLLDMKKQGYSEESAKRICGSLQSKLEGKKHMKDTKLFSDLSAEIFSVGKWNGDKYKLADLESMVSNFDALKDTVKPPAKIGHSEHQDLLKKEGLPAAGWVDSLKMVGNKVIATFKDVPKVVKDLIDKKAYKRVSAEIYPSYKDPTSGKIFKNVLRAVAFLGSDCPAIDSLSDILKQYSKDEKQEFKIYEFKVGSFDTKDTKVRFINNKITIKLKEIT